MNGKPGQEVWLPLLLAAPKRVIAITGSGGKTSLLYYLADLLRQHGQKVIISLTTKMYLPTDVGHQVVFADNADSLAQAAGYAGSSLCTVARAIDPADPRKLAGLPPAWFGQAQLHVPDVFFLVEADGSAGKPLKGYLPHEPVIPSAAALVIPVVGLDVIGKSLTDQHVHRAAIAADLCGQQINDTVAVDTIVRLLQSPAGYRKEIPATAKTVFFLNKAETSAAYQAANSIANHLLTNLSTSIVIGSIHDDKFLLRVSENFPNR